MKNQKASGVSIIVIMVVIIIISRFINASQKAQYKAEHPNPTVTLSCSNCAQGIPIYDSWSVSRSVVAYAQNGEACEVTATYTTEYSMTLQPHATYAYVDTLPHLYVHCPSGQGFVYAAHTTY